MSRKKFQGTDLDETRTASTREARPDDLVDVYKFPPNKWVTVRIFDPIFTTGQYWITTKKADGSTVRFPKACPSYDPSIQSRDTTIYDPWRDAAERINTKENRIINFQQTAWVNAIIRSEQKNEPKKAVKPSKAELKSGFTSKESSAWTPVKVLRLTMSTVKKIQELRGLNTVESKKTGQSKNFSVTHPVYGCDVMIKFDPDAASAAQMYDVQMGKRRKLTEEELAYLRWDISLLYGEQESEEEIKRDFASWAKRNGVKVNAVVEDDEDDGYGDEEDDVKPKAKKTKKSKAKTEEVDYDDIEDEEEEEETPPKKSKKASKKSKAKDVDSDDEWEDEDDADDEDEDEKPKKSKSKAKAAKPSKKSGKKSKDSTSVEDEDEKPKSKKSKKSKKVEVEEDLDEDDLDDEDLDDEDLEDEKPKSKKSKKAKPSKKSKKPEPEEEDDEDDDWGDDDDEDDDWD